MITAPGVGSGLDVSSIISQLMTLERRPLTVLQSKAQSYQTQLSDYGKLKSAISAFQTAMSGLSSADKFKVFSATSSDEAVLTATASSTAAAGSNNIEVVRIAERHKMVADTAFSDTDTVASGTTMTLTVGSDSFAVDIGGMTLSEARSAINNASDNTGVTATVANVDGGSRLILTADETGSTSALSVAYSSGDPFALQTINTDRDASGGFTADDLDAVLILEGTASLTATRSSNTVSDLISGVTLNLKSAGTIDLTIARDNDGIKANIQEFADAYNNVRKVITDLRKGSLKTDRTLVSIESSMLGVINNPASGLSGSYSYLSEIGVSIQKDGTMKLDSTVLDNALNADFNGVSELFSDASQGFAVRFKSLADDFLLPNGVIDSREDGLNARIKDNKDQQARLELRLVSVEKRMRAQYAALDTLVGSLTTTSQFLTQQLARL